jgi:hypothetical protein
MKKGDARLGWHILGKNGVLGYDDGRTPKLGESLEMKSSRKYEYDKNSYATVNGPELCRAGMHASPHITDAIHSFIGRRKHFLTFVLVHGEVTNKRRKILGMPAEWDKKKFVGRNRVILGKWTWNHVNSLLRDELKKPNMGFTSAWAAVEQRLLRSLGIER